MYPPLAAGFLAASAFVTAAVAAAGPELELSGAAAFAVAGVLALLATLELTSLRRSLLRRQTPRELPRVFGRRTGAMMWGLDTGAMVTTIRSSFGTYALLILCAVGAANGWAGVAYAVGFCLPLGLLLFAPLWRTGGPEAPRGTPGVSLRTVRVLVSALMLASAVALVV
jgi:hypothetical protein